MYFNYNSILRQLEGRKILTSLCNTYCTTIHCIVSGIVKKLSSIGDAEVAGSRLGRGVTATFSGADEFVCRGGVDFGLISTSRSMQVALREAPDMCVAHSLRGPSYSY